MVIFMLNYLLPVQLPNRNELIERYLDGVWFFLMYWFSLVIYCLETMCLVLAVTLDAAFKLTPVINSKYRQHGDQIEAVVLLFLAIRVAFNTPMFSFFLYKIFHGNRDLFSEPSDKLTLACERVPVI